MENKEVDVHLLVEGTYPYVLGGVASWIHQLILGLSELRFGVIFLGSKKEEYGKMQYKLPDNLVHFEEHYLFEKSARPGHADRKGSEEGFEEIKKIHKWFETHVGDTPTALKKPGFYTKEVDESQFFYSKRSWEFITENYKENCHDMPFIDYYWTVISTHMPIWKLARIAENLRAGRIIHSASAGYAGFLGALASYKTRRPFIITEHGIYNKERKIDLLMADWLADRKSALLKQHHELGYLNEQWINFFDGMSRFIYGRANPVISIYDGAREFQVSQGAIPERTRVIPNAVDVDRFSGLIAKRTSKIPKVVSLLGRVVSIKDIKTFIKAIRIVLNKIPEVQGWIVGPEETDKEYAKECHDLTRTLGLQESIKFLGKRHIDAILLQSGLITITSISEAMPLTILEGFAAGVPAVSTDVGGCRQLIEGGIDDFDRELGNAGEIVQIANPAELAEAYTRLLSDEKLWSKCQDAALKRVRTYYNKDKLFDAYRSVYNEALSYSGTGT